ncbi:MAG: phosphate signaling complex protein PhoU [Chromatiales bacterium]|jgi:phosphate transport system protein|nr:phosphate signaling complex protein PhoU [Chromatiales bacterium]MDH3894812.1 phosphate signaling complex protein PhoU [Chromatiales bacterium]MDH4014175.1 phosphate signaling complex protein PhoU [Chromatiales bacterium]PLX55135.1 MAG: phosphate transport system regulatory protein PhoU [Chromatiales bacterium]
MDTTEFSGHTSREFNEELEALRSKVLEMGGLVERQIEGAVESVVKGDSDLGLDIADNDEKVNTLEVEIDSECARILALRAPTAVDLRLILAVIKIITDLERMGDEAKRVGIIGSHLASIERPANSYREVKNLGAQVKLMVRGALDSFARGDEQAAARVKKLDRGIDEEFDAVSRQSVTFMLEDPRTISRVLDVMWVVRALERIGDHAKNVCEHVVYMSAGQIVAHGDIDAVAASVSRPR